MNVGNVIRTACFVRARLWTAVNKDGESRENPPPRECGLPVAPCTSMVRRCRQAIADDAGATLLEAALVAPVVLFLTFAIVDVASIFYAQLALQHGVSEATRTAVTGNPSGVPRQEWLEQQIQRSTPALTIPEGSVTFSHLPPGADAWVDGSGGPGDIERVSVDYSWTLYTPVLRPFFPSGEVPLRAESARRNESIFP